MATIPLALFLWKRIHEVGVRTVMGLPGDFNLQLLDQIYNVPDLQWVGNANELNAAYATDGYARVKNGAGCLVTTHGVGEMSAINGVAGAMTEQVKVIHVVGQTTRPMQKNNMMIHHSIGPKPDHQIFNKASKGFRVAEAELQDVKTAPAEIDRVLRECFLKSCPVYIFVPLDIVDEQVSASLLDTPLDLLPANDDFTARTTDSVISAIEDTIAEAKNPVVLVDVLILRYHAVDELKALLEKLQFPVYSTTMGKGIFDEDNPLWAGVYNGRVSSPGLAEAFEKNDLVLLFGNLPADTNTGGFSRVIDMGRCIDFKPDQIDVKGLKTYADVHYKTILPLLTKKISSDRLPKVNVPSLPEAPFEEEHETNITHSWVWHKLTAFLKPHDIVFGETGTTIFGMTDAKFPSDITWHSQTYYGSIGYATAATLGADLARQELAAANKRPSGRTVLITGEGSLQLTLQEIGTMIHYKACPIIFLINNAGYTIERVIHGAKQRYNDVVPYNYSKLLELFGMPEEDAKKNFHRAETKQQLVEVLEKVQQSSGNGLVKIVEIIMDPMDAPWRLVSTIATRGEASIRELKQAGFVVREPVPKV